MKELNVNVNKVKNACTDIVRLANDYNLLINNFFDKINNLQKNNVWIGNDNSSLNSFVEKIHKKENSYLNLGININKIGKIINEYVVEIEKTYTNRE